MEQEAQDEKFIGEDNGKLSKVLKIILWVLGLIVMALLIYGIIKNLV